MRKLLAAIGRWWAGVTRQKPTPVPRLSKSRFLSGRQCAKRLWLECRAPELAAAADERTEAIFAQGVRVGEEARRAWPGGVLVTQDHVEHDDAIEVTRRLLADPSVPAVFEAAFTFDDVRIRADVLARNADGGIDLFEVKSSTSVRDEHLWDVAIQLRVLEGSGVRVGRAFLMHLDRQYVHPGGDYDHSGLFRAVDVTASARELLCEVPGLLANMRAVLAAAAAPDVTFGPHCRSPWPCPFAAHCRQGAPEWPIDELPRLRPELWTELLDRGIRDVREVPDEVPGLNLLQRRAIETVRSGERFVDPAIGQELSGARFPVHFLDFETVNPALPRIPGTRPYEVLPFQWSDHVLLRDGTLLHGEFLDDSCGDPRRRFAESLIEALGADDGSIAVWSPYEDARLADLAAAFPDLAGPLESIRGRLLDLHRLVQAYVYDPGFRGSFSMKRVFPVLAGGGYADLEIRDGAAASLAWPRLVDPATPPDERRALRRALLAYCARDTEALARIFLTLRGERFVAAPAEPVAAAS